MPVDSPDIGHTSQNKKTYGQMTIKATIKELPKKRGMVNPPHGNHEDSRPLCWHLPLPHILPAHLSKGKSQTHPQPPMNKD